MNRMRASLGMFVTDVFASMPRKDQRAKGDCYLRGLMLDGRRKSIQPMAQRLPDGDMQALQQFVNQSPSQWTPARRRIAERLVEVVRPEVWVTGERARHHSSMNGCFHCVNRWEENVTADLTCPRPLWSAR